MATYGDIFIMYFLGGAHRGFSHPVSMHLYIYYHTGFSVTAGLENYFDGRKYIHTYNISKQGSFILFLALMTANY